MTSVMTSQSRHTWDVGTYLVSLVRGDPKITSGTQFISVEGFKILKGFNKRYKNTLAREGLTKSTNFSES